MNIVGPERYVLQFNSKAFSSRCAGGTDRFSGLAVQKKPKLYIVNTGMEIVYVGGTIRPMRDRLRDGWSAKGSTGYYGYRWRHEIEEAGLDIWLLDDVPRENAKITMETMEAELVHLIRCSGQWPRYQTEIHFHHSSEEHRAEAKRIYAFYQNGPTQGPST